MKFLLVIALIAILCSVSDALNCYKCTGCRVGDTSLQETCTDANAVCAKASVTVAGQTLIASKGCNTICIAASTGDSINGGATTCCNTDLCNSATSMSTSLMALAFLFLSSILNMKIFQ